MVITAQHEGPNGGYPSEEELDEWRKEHHVFSALVRWSPQTVMNVLPSWHGETPLLVMVNLSDMKVISIDFAPDIGEATRVLNDIEEVVGVDE